MSNTRDGKNPYTPVTANDLAEDLVEHVAVWYRGHRYSLSAAQQTAAITAITSILNGNANV